MWTCFLLEWDIRIWQADSRIDHRVAQGLAEITEGVSQWTDSDLRIASVSKTVLRDVKQADGDDNERDGWFTQSTLSLRISYEDFDLGGGSDTDDRSPSPLSIPIVLTGEFPGEFPGVLDAASIIADWKTESDDWFVPYVPRVPRSLDISHTYMTSATRASSATSGSARTAYFSLPEVYSIAQIYDIPTGSLVYILNEETVGQEGSLRTRAVYFSPDGRRVPTPAQGRLFRVRLFLLFRIPYLVRLTRNAGYRYGISANEGSATPSQEINKQSKP